MSHFSCIECEPMMKTKQRKFKTCFECEYSFLRGLDGSEIISSGTENCLNNLSAEDNDITITEVRTKFTTASKFTIF